MREKVLYLSGFSPFSINGGGNQRCKLILDALLTKYDVDVVVDFEPVNDLEACALPWGGVQLIDINDDTSPRLIGRTIRKILLNFFPRSSQHLMPTNVWRYRKIHKLIKENNYRWIVIRYLAGVTYHKLYGFKNLVIDIDDIPYLKLESNLRMEHRVLSRQDLKKIERMREISTRIAKLASVNLLPDRRYCGNFHNCHYLPNIPIRTDSEIRRSPANRIIFVGSMTQDMNFKGVDRFISNIWPIVKKRNPQVEFHIIGKGTPDSYHEKWQKTEGVVIRGFVYDIDSEYAAAIAAIAPIYSGAGTNIKVLEALQKGCPIVVSPFAMRGFEDTFIDGVELMVAKSDNEFIERLDLLINDMNVNRSLSKQGRIKVENEYSFDHFCELLHQAMR